jgi:signal transduction histidine kinase
MQGTEVAKTAQVAEGIAMHAPTEEAPSQPVLMRFLVRSWEYERPRLWIGVRISSGIFNIVLGVALLTLVRWLGPLASLAAVPLAGAVLIFWTVYRLQQDSLHRVRQLEQSRAHLVDDSAARLRQIERDLHDGAQAQMVAVAMKLGLARNKLSRAISPTTQPDLQQVLELVDAAHRGAKEAITELRDLARGIHPPVLDHGLGAALITLAARSDVPVELAVDLPERPSAAIETIAYFCAAELLTNVAKHSGARHATLEATQARGVVRVRVTDDGTGGARLEARGGLAGLADRIRTVDGRLQITSPPHGPTLITVELASRA